METRSRLRRKTTTGAPANTDLRPWELCWHTDGKLYIGVGDTDGHATSVQQISGAGANVAWGDLTGIPAYATRWPAWGEVTSKPYFSAMAFETDAPNNGLYYARRNFDWYALGSAANYNVGTSGATVPLLNATNTWSSRQVVTNLLNVAVNISGDWNTITNGYGYGLVIGWNAAVGNGNVDFYNAYRGGFDFWARDAAGTNWSRLAGLDGSGRLTCSGADFSASASFGNVTASSISDLSKHIDLYGGAYGFCITASTLNYNVTISAQHSFNVSGTQVASINGDGLRLGSGARIKEIVVTSTTPSSNSANSGKLYLVY